MKVSFFDSRGVVHALVTDKGERVRLSMDIKVSPYTFKGRFVGKGEKIEHLNHELERRRVLLGDICIKYGVHMVRTAYSPEPTKWEAGTDVAKLCQEYIEGMRGADIRTKGAKQFSLASINTYADAANCLSKFMSQYEFENGSRFDIRLFNLELKEKAVSSWNKMFRRFEDYMVDRGMSVRSRQNYINQIGIMLRYWGEHMFIPLPKTPSVLKAEKDVIALPPSFISEFFNSPRPDDDEQRMVWEIAAIILATTLRISDVMSLTPNDFSHDFKHIRKVLSKTGTCSMPLPSALTDILIENMAKGGWLFTCLPNRTSVYRHLRQMMSKYPSLRQMVTFTAQDIHGKKVTERMPYWMVVTPHVLRKTAITSMLYAGVSHIHVRHASGHSQSSKSFWQYVKVVDDLYEKEMTEAHRKMGISI
jgi:integrase